MNSLKGLLRIRIKRGVNLAVRDINTSDPYIIIRMGAQKLRTRIMERDVNPVWNEDLTIFVYDTDLPIKLEVYDHDFFSTDDKMGDAEFHIQPFVEGLKKNLKNVPSGTVITRIKPTKTNCLAEESCITWTHSAVVQDLCLRLRNVECGEVEIELHWIDVPGCTLV
ncbi:C2 domain-containing protein [Artemisia annua]|uniref:C2 domain-containing protein n=1 Tax=Artemisia annua TaxID=35608 RepID=A0A2U1KXL4_ARTAN|nr:C2 domain-containing protein [Artemisia annua]